MPGSLVAAGSPILSIQPQGNTLEVLVYLPSLQAKAVQPGMAAEISPSTVKREEFGFIRGKVVYVGEFPASSDALMRNFQNETLVHSIMAGGPGDGIAGNAGARSRDQCSGYKWSSSRGPAITISSGTLCTVEVITRQQRAGEPAVSLLQGEAGAELIPWAQLPLSQNRPLQSKPWAVGCTAAASPLPRCCRWKRRSAGPPRWASFLPTTGESFPWRNCGWLVASRATAAKPATS